MELSQTIIVFFIETGIFLIILVGCLKLASNQHRKQLINILKETRAAKTGKLDEQNNEALVSELNHQIAMLKQDLLAYSNLKKQHQKVTSEYHKLVKLVENVKTHEIGASNNRNVNLPSIHAINYLPNKKDLASCSNSLNNATKHVISLVQFIREQQISIETLSNAENTKFFQKINASNNPEKTVQELKNLLEVSQENNKQLQNTINNLKHRLEKATQFKTGEGTDIYNNNEFTSTTQSVNKSASSEEGINNLDLEESLYEYHKIKQEVLILRENTVKQRILIFSLEEQLYKLKNNFDSSTMTSDESKKYYDQIEKLEKLIKESEICIEVLESEVSFLHQKLTTFSLLDDTESAPKENIDKPNNNRLQYVSNAETKIRDILRQILALALSEDPKKAIGKALDLIIESFQHASIDTVVKIETDYGEALASTTKPLSKKLHEHYSLTLKTGAKSISNTNGGYIVTEDKLAVFVDSDIGDGTKHEKEQDTVEFITLVSNIVFTLIDDNQTNKTRLNTLNKLVYSVRKKISNISIQAKYQRDEAKLIFSSLMKELNNCLNTLNITENQSIFFEQMLSEAKARMEILLESDIVVDKSFANLLDSIEDSTKHTN